MKTLLLLATLMAVSGTAFSQSTQDSVLIDKTKTNKLIEDLKKRLEPDNYGMDYQKDFSKKGITFHYPGKIRKGESFDIEMKWKGEVVMMFGVDPITYKFVEVIDLR